MRERDHKGRYTRAVDEVLNVFELIINTLKMLIVALFIYFILSYFDFQSHFKKIVLKTLFGENARICDKDGNGVFK